MTASESAARRTTLRDGPLTVPLHVSDGARMVRPGPNDIPSVAESIRDDDRAIEPRTLLPANDSIVSLLTCVDLRNADHREGTAGAAAIEQVRARGARPLGARHNLLREPDTFRG